MLVAPLLASSTVLPVAVTDPAGTTATPVNIWVAAGFLLFALVVVGIVAFVYHQLATSDKDRPITLTRVVALICVVAAAVALAFSGAPAEALTAAFTLLGIVAGYLAGSKTPVKRTEDITPGAADGRSTVSTTETIS